LTNQIQYQNSLIGKLQSGMEYLLNLLKNKNILNGNEIEHIRDHYFEEIDKDTKIHLIDKNLEFNSDTEQIDITSNENYNSVQADSKLRIKPITGSFLKSD